ncbi:MAG: serine O-acetyltransferase [Clostridia bacterium]|nr:serine O-acetyltransferase [Clostridia bacterium]
MFDNIKADLAVVLEKDPAARSKFEVFFTYGGFRALCAYRRAHWFYIHKMPFIAQIISFRARKHYGIEIHPAAKIGKGIMIDHGNGLVIGETTEIGDNVIIYQGVTLGGTGKDVGKRHPTIGNNVMICAGSKILGPVTIGDHTKIGAGSVVLKDVPPHCTVVGVPGRIVKMHGEKYNDMDQKLPDPVLEEFARINRRLEQIENNLNIHACRYSISQQLETDETGEQ